MIKAIENGESIAITPDGPKGPKEIVKDGIIKLAQTTGAPIVPLFWKVKNHKLLNSWDNFIIPFPFSKGVYIFGEPIHQSEYSALSVEDLRDLVKTRIQDLICLLYTYPSPRE